MACPLVPLSNGRTMPSVGFGTWRCDPDKLAETVLTALRAGVRHIDTAGIYRNEGLLGKAIRTVIDEGVCTREDLFLTSKLGCGHASRGQLEAAVLCRATRHSSFALPRRVRALAPRGRSMTQMFPEKVLPAIKQSIADLGVDYLDLYLTVRRTFVTTCCTTRCGHVRGGPAAAPRPAHRGLLD